MILEPPKIKSDTVSTVSPSISHDSLLVCSFSFDSLEVILGGGFRFLSWANFFDYSSVPFLIFKFYNPLNEHLLMIITLLLFFRRGGFEGFFTFDIFIRPTSYMYS